MAPRKPSQDSAEDRLIARHFGPLATHPGALGLADDAAVVAVPPAHELVLTTDAVIAGVHFFPDDPADAVARKALRVNLSDLAAKGAKPLGFLLSLAITKDIDDGWLKKFAAGLRADIKKFGCPLLGGDTDRTPGLVTVAMTAFGTVPCGAMVLRGGARPDVAAGRRRGQALGSRQRHARSLAAPPSASRAAQRHCGGAALLRPWRHGRVGRGRRGPPPEWA